MAYWPYRLGCNWPPCQITVPLVYDESLSAIEQIGVLYGLIKQINTSFEGLVTNEMFQKFVDYVIQDQIDQTNDLKNYTDDEVDNAVSYLEDLIRKITIGEVIVYDPSTGFKKTVEKALSHSYNDLRYYAMSWDEWGDVVQTDEYNTWDKVDTYLYSEPVTSEGYSNIRSVDLFNRILFKNDSKPR